MASLFREETIPEQLLSKNGKKILVKRVYIDSFIQRYCTNEKNITIFNELTFMCFAWLINENKCPISSVGSPVSIRK